MTFLKLGKTLPFEGTSTKVIQRIALSPPLQPTTSHSIIDKMKTTWNVISCGWNWDNVIFASTLCPSPALKNMLAIAGEEVGQICLPLLIRLMISLDFRSWAPQAKSPNGQTNGFCGWWSWLWWQIFHSDLNISYWIRSELSMNTSDLWQRTSKLVSIHTRSSY